MPNPAKPLAQRLEDLQDAVREAMRHLVNYGKIELGTPQSKALINALAESEKEA